MIAIAAFASLAAASMISGEARGEGSGGIATAGGGDDAAAVGGESDSASRNSAKYERLWDRVDRPDRRWARRTAKCESGRDPDAIGGGGRYRGAFQFMKSTWKSAPKSPGGDPIAYSYRTQAVVAVLLKQRDGAVHWPVCG